MPNERVLTDGAALPQFDPPPESGGEAPAEFRVSFPGPFSHHRVVVDGWSVPLLHAHPCGGHDEHVMLVIDNRIAITVSVEEAERFVPFLADAMAVALGYTAHPRGETEFEKKPQPRPVRMHGIGALASEDAA
jgi:hypothetical protein